MDTKEEAGTVAAIICPHCTSGIRQVKAGMSNGSQRYKCMACGRRYIVDLSQRGYPDSTRSHAVQLFADGKPIREIARELGVNHQTVSNWIHQADKTTVAPPDPVPTPAKRRPAINDVARVAKVSTTTVSNYLNNSGRMAEATRDRIRAAMEELHFTPSALVRAIRHQRTNILGVLIFGLSGIDRDVSQSLTPPLLGGVSQEADRAAYDMLLYSGWPERRHSGLDFLNGHIDGLLWVAPEMGDAALERVAAAGLPVVGLLSRHVPDGVGYVNADNHQAMHLLVSHLVERGHRRIAYMGPVPSSNFIDRLAGYRDALRSNGIDYDPALESIIDFSAWGPATCEPTVESWLALPKMPTAIMAGDDGLAGLMVDSLAARGLRVPEDIALTGFNDTPSAAVTAGGLTTIRQPFREIGQMAAKQLLAMIEGAPATECRVTVPATLIIRATTGGA